MTPPRAAERGPTAQAFVQLASSLERPGRGRPGIAPGGKRRATRGAQAQDRKRAVGSLPSPDAADGSAVSGRHCTPVRPLGKAVNDRRRHPRGLCLRAGRQRTNSRKTQSKKSQRANFYSNNYARIERIPDLINDGGQLASRRAASCPPALI